MPNRAADGAGERTHCQSLTFRASRARVHASGCRRLESPPASISEREVAREIMTRNIRFQYESQGCLMIERRAGDIRSKYVPERHDSVISS